MNVGSINHGDHQRLNCYMTWVLQSQPHQQLKLVPPQLSIATLPAPPVDDTPIFTILDGITPDLPTDNHPTQHCHIIADDDDDTSSTTPLLTDVGPTQVSTVNIAPSNPNACAVDHYYGITGRDLEQVYFSPHHYSYAFEECFTYYGSPTLVHPTAGLVLRELDGRYSSPTLLWEHHMPRFLAGSHTYGMSAF